MRSTFRVLLFLVAAEVLVQGMAIAYGIAGMGHWVEENGGVVNKALFDSDNPHFPGIKGFMLHGMNGMMVIPILVLLTLIVSFFAKVPGASKRAGILVGLVVLQVVLGIMSHSIPGVITLHVLNAFAIFTVAAMSAVRLRSGALTPEAATTQAAPVSV